jgi:ComF family protein
MQKFLASMLDFIIPARPTERRVRTLSFDELCAIATVDGPLPYHDPRVRALVWEIKYRHNKEAAALAAAYLAELVRIELGDLLGAPLLLPLPMHPERRKERGYNQTEFLCEAMLPHIAGSAEYADDVLVRTKLTAPQQGLAKHKRLTNVKKSMEIKDPARVRGRVCIVIDDVSTTGASFVEASRALRLSGAVEVRCVPLARS